MDWETYKLSRLYLARFRLLYVMMEIIKNAGGMVPIERLTPEWYIERYLRDASLPEYFHRHRLIHDPDDKDIESDGMLRDALIRKPRHLSHAEVRSLFASHAQWLVRDQKKVKFQKTRVIDVQAWEAWLVKAKKWSAAAKRDWEDDIFGKFDPDDDSDLELLPASSESEPEPEEQPQADATAEHSEPEASPPPGRPKRKRRVITSVGSTPSRHDPKAGSSKFLGCRRRRLKNSRIFLAAVQTTR